MIFLVDFDGVLTNGKLTITHDGSQLFKEVHTRDIRAIRELIARGNEVYIVTASESPIIRTYARKVGAEVIVCRNKATVLKFVDKKEYVAVVDDSWDISLIQRAVKCFAPADGYHLVKNLCTVLKTKGGEGAMAEVLDWYIHSSYAL